MGNEKNQSSVTDASVSEMESWVLDEASEPAWQAYNAMFESKQAHFAFMELLENKKKKFNLSPTADDREKLDGLLAAHDKQVRVFTEISMALKTANPSAHQNLFAYIAQAVQSDKSENTQH